MKIRKGDRVRVLTGKDQGKEGEVMSADPRAGQGHRRGRQRRQAPPEADPLDAAGRHHRQGDADRRLERRAHRLDGKSTRVGYRVDANGTEVPHQPAQWR